MSKLATGFFAHPSQPPALVETIGNFIKQINQSGSVQLFSWVSMNITGKSLITEVCSAIDARDFFLCDLTILNPNVLFELGYAIARRKRIWITLDTSYRHASENYRRLEILTTIGYARYHNTQDLIDKFYEDRPYEYLQETIFRSSIETFLKVNTKPGIFYLKSEVETDASARLTMRLNRSNVPIMTNDPYEIGTEPLPGYIQRIHAAIGVVAHLLDDERGGDSLQSAKYSLICGLAYGLDKPLLMLAHAPFTTPLDYMHLLVAHPTASACDKAITAWLPTITVDYAVRLTNYQQFRRQTKKKEALQDVNLGDYVAEDEADELGRYFITTAQYLEATQGPRAAIFVGRKGTGKSANFNQIAATHAADRRYHVCQIRPVDYELHGLTELLQQYGPRAERGHLIQAFWKFLIYTEVARSVWAKLESLPAHTERTADEKALIAFAEEHGALIRTDFSDRLRRAIDEVIGIDVAKAGVALNAQVTNALHDQVIGQLRTLLGRLLAPKEKVFILVDNLDKTWGDERDLPTLSEFLVGLLNTSLVISEEFRRTGPDWRQVKLSLLVFLRSDIFNYVTATAAEKDKINAIQMNWNNHPLLHSVIERRFINSVGALGTSDDVWIRFFTPSIGEVPVKEYLVKRIVPRPRDIIFWCKAALNNAINSRHERIEEDDLLQAERDYSQYAFESLITETVRRVPQIERVLYEFSSQNRVLTHNQVRRLIRAVGIENEAALDVIDLLCDTAFLGMETKANTFTFMYDESSKRAILAQANNFQRISKEQRFAVNVPYHSFLGINMQEVVTLDPPKAANKAKATPKRRR